MHGLVEQPHVDHLHPDSGIALATSADGEKLTAECFGDRVVWVPWRRPGFQLGLDIAAIAAVSPQAIGCVLGGHGITAWGATSEECEARSLEIIRTAAEFIAANGRPEPFGPVIAGYEPLPEAQRRARAAELAPVIRGVDATRLYEATGIAVHSFNTLFQLMAEGGSAQIRSARHALLIPDLMTYWLSGQMGTELTNASTTGLLDTRTMTWATGVADALGVPAGLFPRLRPPGELAGPMTRRVASGLSLPQPPQVVIGPSHDTAAAVVGVPAADDAFAFVCTGTWALAGVELPAPIITGAAREAGFTNEAGIDGTIRFLRNVTGFWLLQECVRQWQSEGRRIDLDELTRAAGEVPGLRALIDVQDPGFAAPGGMPQRIARACLRTSGVSLSAEAEILRCILDSMAVAIRHAVRDAEQVSGHQIRTVHIVGGGVANPLFCQLVADACGTAGRSRADRGGLVGQRAGAGARPRRDRRIAARAAVTGPARRAPGYVPAGRTGEGVGPRRRGRAGQPGGPVEGGPIVKVARQIRG